MATTRFVYTWILWFHDPDNKNYTLESYIKIADITTPQQFWSVIDAISNEAWVSGMFFFMRKGFKPIWDAPENVEGGAWSKKIESKDAYVSFIDAMVFCATNELLVQNQETLVGITISPKGAFSIIKIWNTTTTISSIKMLSKLTKLKIADDVTYTPHKARCK